MKKLNKSIITHIATNTLRITGLPLCVNGGKFNMEKISNTPLEKKCSKCNEVLHYLKFYVRSKQKSGLTSQCKQCIKQYQTSIKTRKSEYDKKYRLINKSKLTERKKEYQKQNREHKNAYLREYMKKYREINRAERLEKYAEYNKIYQKAYREKNKKAIVKKQSEYNSKKYIQDLNYNLMCKLRARIKTGIKKVGGVKSQKTYDLLGCSYSEFKMYFQSKFTKGMTWEKFMNSEIHIDHIIPCSKFDLTNEAEQKICFHYTNLQPLWALDNLKKGNKIIEKQLILI
jgi:hypothetical protein